MTPLPGGLAEHIRAARMAKDLTWYAVAKLAGVPNSNTVRDIEAGRDAQLSSVIAVANALGLRVELVRGVDDNSVREFSDKLRQS